MRVGVMVVSIFLPFVILTSPQYCFFGISLVFHVSILSPSSEPSFNETQNSLSKHLYIKGELLAKTAPREYTV